jgi:hypothetical protein
MLILVHVYLPYQPYGAATISGDKFDAIGFGCFSAKREIYGWISSS